MNCELCELVSSLEENQKLIQLDEHWTINEFQGELQRPRYVLQVIEHKTSFSQLTPAEQGNLSEVLTKAISVLETQPNVEKVYVESFNETYPGHLHIHLTPRFQEDEELGPNLKDKQIPNWDYKDVWKRLEKISDAEEVPFVTASARAITGFWKRFLSPYRLLAKNGSAKRFGFLDAAELYVGLWLLTLIGLSVLNLLVPLSLWGLITVGIVGLYRTLDIGTFVFSMMLSTRHTSLVGLSRSLILMLSNLIEISLAAGLMLSMAGLKSQTAFLAGLSLFGTWGFSTSSWDTAHYALFLISGITFFITGVLAIAIVINKIGDRFSSRR